MLDAEGFFKQLRYTLLNGNKLYSPFFIKEVGFEDYFCNIGVNAECRTFIIKVEWKHTLTNSTLFTDYKTSILLDNGAVDVSVCDDTIRSLVVAARVRYATTRDAEDTLREKVVGDWLGTFN